MAPLILPRLQPLIHKSQNTPMSLIGRSPRIDYDHALRFPRRDRQIPLVNAGKERPGFLLETILVPMAARSTLPAALVAAASPAHAHGGVGVEQQSEIGLQVSAQHAMQFEHRVAAQLAAAPLVSFRRVGETIAEHNAAVFERGG